jgi:type II secretory pathway predicted ATPase ExeA
MIKEYFEFKNRPFDKDIPCDELYSNTNNEECMSRLEYAIKEKRFAVVTGDSGSGKTTILRKLVNKIDRNKYQAYYISDSALTPRNFYYEILNQMGCTAKFYRGDAKRQLHKEIWQQVEEKGRVPIIVVDEAHLLTREMLEEIRFLLNFKMDSYNPLSLILSGQTELRETLRKQIYEAISQRVQVRYHMQPMERKETEAYIERHLIYAGRGIEIFSDRAIDVIQDYTGGLLRKINTVCISSLLYATVQKKRVIDDYMVKYVIENELEW